MIGAGPQPVGRGGRAGARRPAPAAAGRPARRTSRPRSARSRQALQGRGTELGQTLVRSTRSSRASTRRCPTSRPTSRRSPTSPSTSRTPRPTCSTRCATSPCRAGRSSTSAAGCTPLFTVGDRRLRRPARLPRRQRVGHHRARRRPAAPRSPRWPGTRRSSRACSASSSTSSRASTRRSAKAPTSRVMHITLEIVTNRGKYVPGEEPKYEDNRGPRCYPCLPIGPQYPPDGPFSDGTYPTPAPVGQPGPAVHPPRDDPVRYDMGVPNSPGERQVDVRAGGPARRHAPRTPSRPGARCSSARSTAARRWRSHEPRPGRPRWSSSSRSPWSWRWRRPCSASRSPTRRGGAPHRLQRDLHRRGRPAARRRRADRGRRGRERRQGRDRGSARWRRSISASTRPSRSRHPRPRRSATRTSSASASSRSAKARAPAANAAAGRHDPGWPTPGRR